MSRTAAPGPAVLCGALLTALAAVRCWPLEARLPSRLLLLCLLLGAGALALWLLRREGVDSATLQAMLLPIGLALFLRAAFLPHATLDYQDFLSQWVDHFRRNGGLAALKDPVGNYNVPYLYLLALLPGLPISDLYGIKFFSIFFDVLLAWGGFRLARCLTKNERAPLAAFTALLLLPTVILNGACWGQCDSVWGALCVLSLSCALEDKPWQSLSLLGLAFAFKLQAIFLVPLYLPLWLGGRIKFQHLFAFPGAFAASMIPALLAGKPVRDILGVYIGQTTDSVGWGTLNYNSPSLFALSPYGTPYRPGAAKVAIVLAFLFMAAILFLLLRRRKELDNAAYALAGACLCLGIPYFLPYMHERYFFLGGALLVIWACASPQQAYAAVAAELASLGGYHAYLITRYFLVLTFFGVSWVQLTEGLLMAAAVAVATVTLVRHLSSPKPAK